MRFFDSEDSHLLTPSFACLYLIYQTRRSPNLVVGSAAAVEVSTLMLILFLFESLQQNSLLVTNAFHWQRNFSSFAISKLCSSLVDISKKKPTKSCSLKCRRCWVIDVDAGPDLVWVVSAKLSSCHKRISLTMKSLFSCHQTLRVSTWYIEQESNQVF